MERKIAVITGTNSNLGLNLSYRLIDIQPENTRLTIVVTSRTLPRAREIVDQLKLHAAPAGVLVDYDYILVDFTDMVSVLSAYHDLSQRYEAIHYFYANAAQGVYAGIDWVRATQCVLTNPIKAATFPDYRIQRVGVKSKDGLGLVFQANVFGPYYLVHKLLPQLSRGSAYVVWISSLMADPKYLSFNDLQMIQSDVSYDGSKRLVDLLHLGTVEEMKKLGIKQYLTHPGIFTSASFQKFLNVFTYYGMLVLFYLARVLGSPWHNIDGFKGANAPIKVVTGQDSDQLAKYGSACTLGGKEFVKVTEVDPTGTQDVKQYFDKLVQEWDEKLADQITNSRQ